MVQFVIGGEADLADDVGGDVWRKTIEIVEAWEDEKPENLYGGGTDHDLVGRGGIELPRAETTSRDDDNVYGTAVRTEHSCGIEHILINLPTAHEKREKSGCGILIGT